MSNEIGAAEAEVGRYVYRLIEARMDAPEGTPEFRELDYLSALVADVEEYGADELSVDKLQAAPASPKLAPEWSSPELERLACEAQEGYDNPIAQVAFRAGFLLCREYMARFVEQGGDASTAASIRANWIPLFGADPGPPRKYDFAEVAEAEDMETGPWRSKDPAVYALSAMHALGMELPAPAELSHEP